MATSSSESVFDMNASSPEPSSPDENHRPTTAAGYRVLKHDVQVLEDENKRLRAQVTRFRQLSEINHDLLHFYRSEDARRQRQVGELVIRTLSGKYLRS